MLRFTFCFASLALAALISSGGYASGAASAPWSSVVPASSSAMVETNGDTDCKCCRNVGGAGGPAHYFVDSACTAEESEFESPMPLNDELPLARSDSGYLIHEGHSLARASLTSLLSVIGEASCNTGASCRKKKTGGGAGNEDTTFHFEDDIWYGANCSGKHGTCDPILELSMLTAIENGDYAAVAKAQRLAPRRVLVNTSRRLLQIVDCRGAIAAQVPIDVRKVLGALSD